MNGGVLVSILWLLQGLHRDLGSHPSPPLPGCVPSGKWLNLSEILTFLFYKTLPRAVAEVEMSESQPGLVQGRSFLVGATVVLSQVSAL